MAIKAKTIFKLVAIVCVPLTGYLAARGTEKYQEEMARLKEEKPEADITTGDKAKAAVKSYGLAAAAGVGAVGSILAIDRITYKELAAAGGAIAVGKKQLERKAREYKAYREATVNTVGAEKESEIRQMAGDIYLKKSYVDGAESDEVIHKFHINWFGFDLEFDATMPEIMSAAEEINRELFDWNSGSGHVYAYKFLMETGHSDLVTKEMEKWGWNSSVLAADCDCYWLPFEIVKRDNEANTYDIWVPWYPNDDIDAYTEEMEAKGVI